MHRFGQNRSWAFVLTLCLFTTCFSLATVQLPTAAYAGDVSFSVSTDDPPPLSVGDPDVPAGPGEGKTVKLSVIGNGTNQVVQQSEVTPAASGAPQTSVVMSRVRLFLLSFRSLYLRF